MFQVMAMEMRKHKRLSVVQGMGLEVGKDSEGPVDHEGETGFQPRHLQPLKVISSAKTWSDLLGENLANWLE